MKSTVPQKRRAIARAGSTVPRPCEEATWFRVGILAVLAHLVACRTRQTDRRRVGVSALGARCGAWGPAVQTRVGAAERWVGCGAALRGAAP